MKRVMKDAYECRRFPLFAGIIESIDRNLQRLPDFWCFLENWRMLVAEIDRDCRRLSVFAGIIDTSITSKIIIEHSQYLSLLIMEHVP